MRIMAVGGGSGGHVTPVLAVLNELKKSNPRLKIDFVCDRKFAPQAQKIMAAGGFSVQFHTIFAGKLRRYHGISIWKQLADIPTVLQNIGDVFLIFIGFLQSLWLLLLHRPNVVFTKGGFVCLPVGMAAAAFRIPVVVHDSDAHPGLTNRILARWATAIATGAPLENYNYPAGKSQYVGIPVSAEFVPSTDAARRKAREELLLEPQRLLIVTTGGGLGAVRLNTALAHIAPELLSHNKPAIEIIHVTGASNAQEVEAYADKHLKAQQRPFYHIYPFVDGEQMVEFLRAADIVVSRGGATALTELAAIGVASILVPNPQLTGGHQLKNAKVFATADAAIVLDETQLQRQPKVLADAILDLAKDTKARHQYAQRIHQFAKPQAAADTAQLIQKAIRRKKR